MSCWHARLVFTAALLLLNTACTPLSVQRLLENPPAEIPGRAYIESVPLVPQTDNYCGPSSLAMVMRHYGEHVEMSELAKSVYIPELGGSLQVEMAAALRNREFMAYPLPGTLQALLEEINAGHPVIVLQNLGLQWFPKWHYAVVIGYDLNDKKLILHSGTTANRPVSLKKFAYTWARSNNWAVVPLPVGELPKQDDSVGVFIAATDLADRLSTVEKKLTLYRAGIQRWPESANFSLALSNVHYQSQNYALSTQVLLEALRKGAATASVYNNLAYSLQAAGCHNQAITAIDCAVQMDSSPAFLDSRDELSRTKADQGQHSTCPPVPACD